MSVLLVGTIIGAALAGPLVDRFPVLALDVYEHAYVRDFDATPDGRKQYVEAFFRNVHWDHVNRQLRRAQLVREAAGESALRR